MRPLRATVLLFLVAAGACAPDRPMSAAGKRAIADSLSRQVRAAYDITKPGVAQRMLALYADSGRIVSAAGGRVVTSHDTLAAGIRYFWTNVGANMRQPKWIWDAMFFDVL